MDAVTLRLRKLPGVRAWAVVDTEPGCYECGTEEYLAFGKTAKRAWYNYIVILCERRRRHIIESLTDTPGTREFNQRKVNELFGIFDNRGPAI